MRYFLMRFYITPLFSGIILKFGGRCVKGVLYGYVYIFIWFAFYHTLSACHCYINIYVIEDALMLVAMGNFHHNPASHDMLVKTVQFFCLFAYEFTQRLREFKIVRSDLQFKFHR